MAEWSKALVLGTSHFDGVGSNPTAATFFLFFPFFYPFFFVLSTIWKPFVPFPTSTVSKREFIFSLEKSYLFIGDFVQC